ncbi:MAG: hypothetical protein ACYTGL_09835 [Planctomycetota bacterium]|jgi:hypothetical protein
MSDENAANEAPQEPATTSAPTNSSEQPKKILLVSYPKLVFLYPTFLAAVACGVLASINQNDMESHWSNVFSLTFLGVITLNLVVLTFDFPRTTSLTVFFFVAMVIMGLYLLFHFNPGLLPIVGDIIASLKPFANSSFYFLFAAVLFIFYLAILVAVRFDYWEIRPNELLHHHGFLSDLKRYPAPNLRIDKEINDVFEYALLRSGRLILHARHESRAIVLDNVLFINRKEQRLTKMLGALQVSVRDDE